MSGGRCVQIYADVRLAVQCLSRYGMVELWCFVSLCPYSVLFWSYYSVTMQWPCHEFALGVV